jgi:hypothetical protein
MSILVPAVLFTFPIVALLIFTATRPARAGAIVLAFGWCFLPMSGYDLPGLPPYSKTTAASYTLLALLLVFSAGRIARVRWHWTDGLFAIWCLSGSMASLANGLGLYDAASSFLHQFLLWGAPYFAGRILIRNRRDLEDVANVIVVFGLIYVPLVLYEARMSPQLHRMVYGFFPHSWVQTMRLGGWRPQVFMAHGLQTSLWMGIALLLASGRAIISPRSAPPPIFGLRLTHAQVIAPLVLGVLATRSLGGWALTLGGLFLLLACRWFRPAPLIGLACATIIVVIGTRATAVWDGSPIPQLVRSVAPDRAGSLQFRLDNEDLLAAKAMQQPLFGWGGWGRNRVFDENGQDISVTDGLWIITFGTKGFVGLASLYGTLVAVYFLASRRFSRSQATETGADIMLVLSVAGIVATMDTIPNAFPIPVMIFATGAVATLAIAAPATRHRPQRLHANMNAGSLAARGQRINST